ncbi:MAG: UDP-N-acetylglucosamine--N-acetylmuramyl-(pentapeptide) pyrophosphoryl-undecaprenol N-acetylglucosamine transferase [Alphaproteobacteria bacterium]|nr:UDP-N-acetylglucosamine--N-acetylmuramyl-(pentapeptide) pyrophosphoryl-undecaprenol N-acetylglucosamine transferase [Alphaproteobacteria bacterium]
MNHDKKPEVFMKIWIATGGTGGHVFPALAVAAELVKRGDRVIISADGRVQEMIRKNKPAGAGTAFVWASGVGAKSSVRQLIALFKIGCSASALALRFMVLRPDKVVAFGGYASVPAILAARAFRIPTYLHEQNAHIGRANLFALRWVDVLMTSFPKVSGIRHSDTVSGKLRVVYTGLPVRKDFIDAASEYRIPNAEYRLLITGGSLGSQILDDVVPNAVAALSASVKKKLFVVHQTRPDAVARLQRFYAHNGIRANVLSFIHDMAAQMAAADLVISRAGASTVVELQTVGRAAILVPLAINPDQPANADAFAKTGAGFNVAQSKFTVKWLSATLAELFSNPARLLKMSSRARQENNAVENIIKTLGIDS